MRLYRPEVVLLDIGLPGMDGYQVAGQLRREGGPKAALIIAVTGYGQEEDRRRSLEAGFDHHLVKPLDFDELLSLLARPEVRHPPSAPTRTSGPPDAAHDRPAPRGARPPSGSTGTIPRPPTCGIGSATGCSAEGGRGRPISRSDRAPRPLRPIRPEGEKS